MSHVPGRTCQAEHLGAELEAATLRELQASWHELNHTYFRGALRPLQLLLLEGEGRLGLFDPTLRRISLARSLVLGRPWGQVLEVLKHEMAHQFVHEVLQVTDETAHGRAFQDVCARLGVDAASSGLPEDPDRSDDEERVLARIARLLALADSPNEHEAQSAMNAAQRLMLRYNLSVAAARPTYLFRHLGEPTGRVLEAERWLATILADHFFVEIIWVPVFRPLTGKRGTVLEICGSRANAEMATYVHTFLRETAGRLWLAHKRDTHLRSDRDRQKYLAGVMLGFLDKLREQEKAHHQEGLVWVRDGNLHDYLRQRHPRVRTVRYQNGEPCEAYEHGREAGRSIVLHRPVSEGSSGAVCLLGR